MSDDRSPVSNLDFQIGDEHFRKLIEEWEDSSVYVVDEAGIIRSWNAGAFKMKGYLREEVLGRHFSLFFPEEERASGVPGKALREARNNGRYEGESWRLKKNGSRFWARVVIRPVDPSGGYPGFFVISWDLTNRNEAEQRLLLMAEAAPSAMIMVNGEGNIVLANAQVEKLFGYERSELLGKPIEMLVPERFRRSHHGHRAGFLASPQVRPMGAVRDLFGLRKDGTEVPVEIGLNPITTQDGVFVLSSIVDIADRKKAEQDIARYAEELRLRNEELSNTNKELEQFAYISSHDLQEPLRKIISFSERVSSSADLKGSEREYLERINAAGQRMKKVIEDLLQFSRLASGRVVFERTDLRQVLIELLADLDVKISESGARITLGDLPVIRANGAQIRHLFQNLILNSIKFAKKGTPPEISIQSQAKDGMFEIRVRDNGIGFDQKYADKVFQPFQRLHGKNEYEGTGIGLSICQKIVNYHRGEIRAESAEGRGATFIVTLPVGAGEGGHEPV
ncbi:MAG: PAS domain S-box protein [Candidatus Omnitrophica bacterium]|nr:PAS domain S-box protein [Candidatus Omnitrophota bacterium]